MPPLTSASKSKGKNREPRRSRSRNTTPSSVISAGTAPVGPTTTPLLDLDLNKLLVSSKPSYTEFTEYLESHGARVEPKFLTDTIEQLKYLSDSAEKRIESCEKAIRLIHEQRKEVESDHQDRERQAEQARRQKARKEESQKNPKAKKRKDRTETFDSVEIKREDEPVKMKVSRATGTPGPIDSPSPSKKTKLSPGTSSLSEAADSPDAAVASVHGSPAKTDVSMSDAEENRVIRGQPSVPQQGFFPDPLAPDPIIYHIRDIEPDMLDAEKKEIYSVTAYPTKDLSDQMAGTPPDKDFSNAKPTNQVAANTFLTYVEPYVRPLTEEDMAWLRERGDRVTPFLAVPRGKRHYTEIWAEEDGTVLVDSNHDKLPANHPRGSVEQISDDNLASDQVSSGPLASRLLSLLKFEHRAPQIENANGVNDLNAFMDGNDTMDLDGLTNGQENGEKPLAPAAAVADLAGAKSPASHRLDYVQTEDRIKSELRHIGFLGQDENPDFDAHHDDDISERMRLLQAELRRVMIVNGARKSRLLDLAKERLAHQEYSTIHEDLDSQVQQAYLKRTRTLGKTKKGGPGSNKPRPGAHGAAGTAMSINRARDIGDNARMLMDRRKRWETCIGPVFKDMKHGIPEPGTSIWDPKIMEAYEKAEMEALDEELAE